MAWRACGTSNFPVTFGIPVMNKGIIIFEFQLIMNNYEGVVRKYATNGAQREKEPEIKSTKWREKIYQEERIPPLCRLQINVYPRYFEILNRCIRSTLIFAFVGPNLIQSTWNFVKMGTRNPQLTHVVPAQIMEKIVGDSARLARRGPTACGVEVN